jgi:Anaerobic ribonucleoside-triphosphate reductase
MTDLSTQSRLKPEALTLDDEERQPCEVWTRVMGYHRPVSSFNTGKKGEYLERKFYREARCTLE